MPGVSRETAANVLHHGPVDDINEDIDEMTVTFLSFGIDIDATPLMKGLPDDRCPCPHWGYVTKGKITYRFADHEETFSAGDAFYVSPGHIPVVEAGTEFVQFSPKDELKGVGEVMERNAQAMQMV